MSFGERRLFDDSEGSFYDSLQKKDTRLLRQHVEGGCDVNQKFKFLRSYRIKHPTHNFKREERHETPLTIAVKTNWKEAVNMLLQAGGSVEQPDFEVDFSSIVFLAHLITITCPGCVNF